MSGCICYSYSATLWQKADTTARTESSVYYFFFPATATSQRLSQHHASFMLQKDDFIADVGTIAVSNILDWLVKKHVKKHPCSTTAFTALGVKGAAADPTCRRLMAVSWSVCCYLPVYHSAKKTLGP